MRRFKSKISSFTISTKELLNSYHPTNNQGVYAYNWWDREINTFWLTCFLGIRCKPIKRINLFSCFGSPLHFIKYYRGVNIFLTGENLQTGIDTRKVTDYSNHLIDAVDLSLGFEFRTEDNYYRFPLWIMHRNFILPNATYADIRDMIDNINNPAHRRERKKREAVLIASHDVTGVRTKIINVVDQIIPISFAGKFRNNTDALKTQYNDNKIEYLKQFRFNICPENSLGDGYITEKVFESIASGCIPIYWGAYLEPGILNPEAILIYEEGKEKELEDKLRELVENEEAYQRFIEIPPFVDGAAERIWEIIQGLEQRLKDIVE